MCAETVDLQNLAVLQRTGNLVHQHEKGEKWQQQLREKTKEYQSRFCKDETKDKIRAERAAKKLLKTKDF